MKNRTLTDADVDAITAQLAALNAKVDDLTRIVVAATVGRPKRSVQAKKAGVSRSTLYRREKKLKTELLLSGRV